MKENRRRKRWEKILLGAVIGSAIFSVIGVAIKPKKDKHKEEEPEDKTQ